GGLPGTDQLLRQSGHADRMERTLGGGPDARAAVPAGPADTLGTGAGREANQRSVHGVFRGPAARSIPVGPAAVARADPARQLDHDAAGGGPCPVPRPRGATPTGPAALPARERPDGPGADRTGFPLSDRAPPPPLPPASP